MNSKRKQLGEEIDEVVFPLAENLTNMPTGYTSFLDELKGFIKKEKLVTILNANQRMILMYWHIGKAILLKQETEGWGAKTIDRLSVDLKNAFPEETGFSPRNLKYMRKFAESWADIEIVQRTVAQIPWRSNITLLDKIKEPELRLWYAQKTIENGFGKDMLAFQIRSRLHLRQGSAITNFSETLPPINSDLANQVLKDPYVFNFLGNDSHIKERELEQKLIDHIQKFLLELGQGFAFVGRQVHLELGDSDFYLDLLFYHIKLKCYVVIELKTGKLEPGHISQLNMYMNVVNDALCGKDDQKTIGLLLVKEKDRIVAKYSLAGINNPIGIANWENEIKKSLPEDLKSNLPSIEEIENEFDEDEQL
jgi:predicted nuclease of restriction endonuclease-like (RecB) superfamily